MDSVNLNRPDIKKDHVEKGHDFDIQIYQGYFINCVSLEKLERI